MSRLYGRPYYKMIRVYPEPTDYFWFKNEESNQVTFNISYTNNIPSSHPQWSTDLITWNYFEPYGSFDIPAGGKVYFRSLDGWSEYDKYWYIANNGNHYSVGGNLATLVNWHNKDSVRRFPDYFIPYFFNEISLLTDASQLTTGSVTTAGMHAFQELFAGCGNITIGDFSSLTTLEYYSMHQMFNGSGITTGIDLSNVTSVDNESFNYMYNSCTNLEDVTAPNLQTWNSSGGENWLQGAGSGVQGTKTAHVPDGVNIPYNHYESGIPQEWTRVTY